LLPAVFFAPLAPVRCAPFRILTGLDAALRRPAIFLFATLAAAVISVVLPMKFQTHPGSSIFRAPSAPAAAIARIIPIISSG